MLPSYFNHGEKKLAWSDLYSEINLYKAAVRLYTTPVFYWRKATAVSTDQKNFYDFARHGLRKLSQLHEQLQKRTFRFRPGIAVDFNFNGRQRTVYVYPWEERLVDLLLYRVLNHALDKLFSKDSYAYRFRKLGIDSCQKKIEAKLLETEKPVYIIKRDVSNFFNAIDHTILVDKLSELIDENDYLFWLLRERVSFRYVREDVIMAASRGIPFGTAIACVFANIYLTQLDRILGAVRGVYYFRYSDDVIFFSRDRETSLYALEKFNAALEQLKLTDKEEQRRNLLFSSEKIYDCGFQSADKFRHLGLEFKVNGLTGLSRDKSRKICNIFKYALRRKRGKLKKIKDPEKRIDAVLGIMNQALNNGIRNVAIIDYYLRHVKDEAQIKLIDRWLAEEALAVILGTGHKKGNFRKISFKRLRQRGLPSLAHRRRLILHRRIDSSFFIWKQYKVLKSHKGTAARPFLQNSRSGESVFSPFPKAAAQIPREREGCL